MNMQEPTSRQTVYFLPMFAVGEPRQVLHPVDDGAIQVERRASFLVPLRSPCRSTPLTTGSVLSRRKV